MTRLLLQLIFVASGACGLAYEIVWGKQFHLILGHTTYAISAVLAAFMTGLALGSWAFGRLADRVRSQATLYAWLELGIGLYALLFLRFADLEKTIYIAIGPHLQDAPLLDVLFKFASSFALIIVPTVLMGGTFPVMVKAIRRNVEQRGIDAGRLYFINSIGGALGCLICGFYLIERCGLELTLIVVATVNIMCGIGALLLRGQLDVDTPTERATPAAQPESATSTTPPTAVEADAPDAGYRSLLFLFALSGFASMLFEISWTRLLVLVLGSSTHSFSIMLATFIAGLALGSLLISRLGTRITQPRQAFAAAELVIGSFVLASIPFYEMLPQIFLWLKPISQISYDACQVVRLLFAAAVMFIPALAFGATFPLAVQAVKMTATNDGSRIGRLYAVNTIGCITGSLATGLLILPHLGVQQTLNVGVAIVMIVAVFAAWRDPAAYPVTAAGSSRPAPALPWRRLLIVMPLVGIVLLPAGRPWDYRMINSGVFYRIDQAPAAMGLQEVSDRRHTLYYKEGVAATVWVFESPGGMRSLKINGKTDGSTGRPDMITQTGLAFFTLMQYRDARRALIIGMGTGATLAAAARFANLEQITCVEISPEVVEAARHFPESFAAYDGDKRVRIVINDARSFLLTTRDQYDVIICEPTNPWFAGVSALFTTDFYRLCRSRLTPNGSMLAWVQAYECSESIYKLMVRTFLDVFPNTTLWFNSGGDTSMVGNLGAPLTVAKIPECFQIMQSIPAVKKMLESLDIRSALDVAAFFLMTREQLHAWVGPGGVNSDNFEIIEYEGPRLFHAGKSLQYDFRAYCENLAQSLELASATRPTAQFAAELEHLIRFVEGEAVPFELRYSLCELLLSLQPSRAESWYHRASLSYENKKATLALADLDRAIELAPSEVRYRKLRALVLTSLAPRRLPTHTDRYLRLAEADLSVVAAATPTDPDVHLQRAAIALDRGDLPAMMAALETSLRCTPDPTRQAGVLGRYGVTLANRAYPQAAIALMQRAASASAELEPALAPTLAHCRQLIEMAASGSSPLH